MSCACSRAREAPARGFGGTALVVDLDRLGTQRTVSDRRRPSLDEDGLWGTWGVLDIDNRGPRQGARGSPCHQACIDASGDRERYRVLAPGSPRWPLALSPPCPSLLLSDVRADPMALVDRPAPLCPGTRRCCRWSLTPLLRLTAFRSRARPRLNQAPCVQVARSGASKAVHLRFVPSESIIFGTQFILLGLKEAVSELRPSTCFRKALSTPRGSLDVTDLATTVGACPLVILKGARGLRTVMPGARRATAPATWP
jgi:hypothetical protein